MHIQRINLPRAMRKKTGCNLSEVMAVFNGIIDWL